MTFGFRSPRHILLTLILLAATLALTPRVGQAQITGLDFHGNVGDLISTIRFKFNNPHTTGLPIYGPGGAGATYIWRIYPRQQTGFYTTFFWGNDDGLGQVSTFEWFASGVGNTYYGAHPFPKTRNGFGTTHFWEIAVDNADFGDPTRDSVGYEQWYTQVLRVWGASGQPKHHEFYWNWPDQTKLVTYTSGSAYGNLNPPAPALTFGDAPWNPSNEICNCILRGFQIYSSLLSLADIASESTTPLSTSVGAAGIWYLRINPTPSDITDTSGKGHQPTWVGPLRPTLWTGPGGNLPTVPTGLVVQ